MGARKLFSEGSILGLKAMGREYMATLSDEVRESDPDAYESPRDRALRVLSDFMNWLSERDA